MSPMKLMFGLVAPRLDKKFLSNMKNDLEGAG